MHFICHDDWQNNKELMITQNNNKARCFFRKKKIKKFLLRSESSVQNKFSFPYNIQDSFENKKLTITLKSDKEAIRSSNSLVADEAPGVAPTE